MARWTKCCLDRGWRPVVLSYWRLDWGDCTDIQAAVQHIRARFPLAPVYAVAFSAGGHLLARYLQVHKEHSGITAAILNSGVADFLAVERDAAVQYRSMLTKWMKLCGLRHLEQCKAEGAHEYGDAAGFEEAFAETSGSRFYDRFLHALPSFSGQDPSCARTPGEHHGYCKLSAGHYAGAAFFGMDRICVPTLLMHAKDDPVVPHHNLNWEKVFENKHIISVTTKRGGHVGWFEGVLPHGATWSDKMMLGYISSVIEINSQIQFQVKMTASVLAQHTSRRSDSTGGLEASLQATLSSDNIAHLASSLLDSDTIHTHY
eukprot:TRINITY_DN13507_c0_g1_i3.p2 TRINITY_DN13507_c0_g1~~TRINITY_DN13507_c0_g1_i3.p2  ORF type:complete len:317 (+),score=94.54 TRINITY_DN13507_c0_g1_i3:476-1426(+)